LFGQFFGEVTVVVVLVGLLGQPQDFLPHLLRDAVGRHSATITVCYGFNSSLAVSGHDAAKLPLRNAE
jgi:hypothetical protein